MVNPAELNVLLGTMAERFESFSQRTGENTHGWGQFLDAPKIHSQVGPYGTSAGVVVLALTHRERSPISRGALSLLQHWWRERGRDAYSHTRFAQTLRLSMLYLAVRLLHWPELADSQEEIAGELVRRALPSGGWGDWWINEERYDSTPRAFTSGIVLLSFLLFRDSPLSEREAQVVEAAAYFLRELLPSSSHLAPVDRASALAGVLAWCARQPNSPCPPIPTSLWKPLISEARGTYFFFYEHSPDNKGRSFGRDYLLVSPAILAAIAGLQKNAPAMLRLASEEVVDQVVNTVRTNNGLYKVAPHDHVSSLDQCWAALLLRSAVQAITANHPLPSRVSRITYGLLKDRRDNLVTSTIIPVTATLTVIALNSAPFSVTPLQKAGIAIGAAIVTAIYGPNALKRILPGRR